MSKSMKSRRSKKTTAGKRKSGLFTEPIDDRVFKDRYVMLSTRFRFLDAPLHPFVIPSGWARLMEGEFTLDECDVSSREIIMGRLLDMNCASIEAYGNDMRAEPQELEWALMFEIGEIETGSWVMMEGGCAASLNIDTTFNLVRATDAEIHQHWRFAGEPEEAEEAAVNSVTA